MHDLTRHIAGEDARRQRVAPDVVRRKHGAEGLGHARGAGLAARVREPGHDELDVGRDRRGDDDLTVRGARRCAPGRGGLVASREQVQERDRGEEDGGVVDGVGGVEVVGGPGPGRLLELLERGVGREGGRGGAEDPRVADEEVDVSGFLGDAGDGGGEGVLGRDVAGEGDDVLVGRLCGGRF